MYVDVELIGVKGIGRFRALVDTGATYTVVPRKVVEEWVLPALVGASG